MLLKGYPVTEAARIWARKLCRFSGSASAMSIQGMAIAWSVRYRVVSNLSHDSRHALVGIGLVRKRHSRSMCDGTTTDLIVLQPAYCLKEPTTKFGYTQPRINAIQSLRMNDSHAPPLDCLSDVRDKLRVLDSLNPAPLKVSDGYYGYYSLQDCCDTCDQIGRNPIKRLSAISGLRASPFPATRTI